MRATIRNDLLTVTADTCGAELQSIESEEGIRYLWNGDPAYWSGRSPTLFPIVGALRGDRAESQAGEIRLPKHGLARRAEWTLESGEADAVTFRLTSDATTREGYPYDFVLRVHYALSGMTLTAAFTVQNTGTQAMPYCIGGHPAFRVPLVDGENFDDYAVEFDLPETADCPQIEMKTGLLRDTARDRLLSGKRSFALSHVLFRGDALVFDRLQSRGVRLFSGVSGHGVRMEFDGFDFFGVWSQMGDAPFVCLEPWTGTGTCVSEDDVFEHKQGMRLLSPGETAAHAYAVTMF